MGTLILCLFIVIGWAVWIALRRSSRKRQVVTRSHHTVTASSEPATPRGESSILINMPDMESGRFTAEDEHQAYTAGQLVWIRYEDKSGMVTERVVEIYRPGDGEVIYTWCRRKQAPRTFVRRNIRNWRLLPERFDFDQIVAKYWDEEGIRERLEKNPWRRWLRRQPKEIADRYK